MSNDMVTISVPKYVAEQLTELAKENNISLEECAEVVFNNGYSDFEEAYELWVDVARIRYGLDEAVPFEELQYLLERD